jgi:hypothetical protein
MHASQPIAAFAAETRATEFPWLSRVTVIATATRLIGYS